MHSPAPPLDPCALIPHHRIESWQIHNGRAIPVGRPHRPSCTFHASFWPLPGRVLAYGPPEHRVILASPALDPAAVVLSPVPRLHGLDSCATVRPDTGNDKAP